MLIKNTWIDGTTRLLSQQIHPLAITVFEQDIRAIGLMIHGCIVVVMKGVFVEINWEG